jgi:hypothetical protein
MKSAQNNPIMASRYTPGAPSCPGGQPAQAILAKHAVLRAADRIAAALDFFVREALPLALPGDDFQPENGTLCSAHWNRIYLIRGAKF